MIDLTTRPAGTLASVLLALCCGVGRAQQGVGGYPVTEPVDFSPVLGQSSTGEPVFLAPRFDGGLTPTEDPWAASSTLPRIDPLVVPAEAPSLPAQDPLGVATESTSPKSDLPPGTRPGLFQGVNLQTDWLPRFGGAEGFGLYGWQANVVFGFPFLERQTPMIVTPQYRMVLLDGPSSARLPAGADVPNRVHEAQVDFHHFRRLNDRWLFDGAVTLGAYGDDDSLGDSEAFRVTGRALGIYQWDERWKAILGVVYLNRAGLGVLPAVGLLYATEDTKIDLVFPRPRVGWRVGGGDPNDQTWVYLSGELGGNLWAVRDATGGQDTLSYSDYRVMLGYERKLIGGVSHTAEFGYVFGRLLEFQNEEETAVNDSVVARIGLSY